MTDLGLDIRTSGRTAVAVEASYVRDLTPSDLALLSAPRDVKAPALTKIRDAHHALARYLAMGLPSAEIQCLTGYSGSRISILKSDPSIQELVEYYRKDVKAIFADLQERMASMAIDGLTELREMLEEGEEKMSPAFLLEMVKTFADRTGHGPATKNTNVNVNVNYAGRLEAARRRVSQIEAKAVDVTPSGDKDV